ncbi:Transposon TX1 uncharacterized 149 kDa protein [Linum perenne]
MTLTEDQRDSLPSSVTSKEVYEAIFSIPDEKTPSSDGFPTTFFKKNWNIVGLHVTEVALSFFLTGKMPLFVNCISLILIPKKNNATIMKNYRSISYCNVMYRLVSKIIANRLAMVLPNVISLSQSAFIKGRAIRDNILLAHKLLKDYSSLGVSLCVL